MNIALISVAGRLPSDGSRLISALLKRNKHRVINVYLARTEPEYEEDELEKLHEVFKEIDLVMIAVYSNYALRAVKITNLVHNNYPGVKVVWGGPHCISAPEHSLKYADIVCYSEGDETVVELVNKMENRKIYTDTANMGFKVNGSTVINQVLQPFRYLNSLPYYDYEFNNQFLLDNELIPLNKNMVKELLRQYPFYIPTLYFLTSRGCPHVCSYCNNNRYVEMFKRNVIRFYGVDRVIDELKHTLQTLDFIDFIVFGDDDFMARPLGQLEDFAYKYKHEIGIPFGAAASVRTYRKDKLEVLLENGLKAFNIGVQSGSQRVLDEVYNRKISLVKTKRVIEEIEPHVKSKKLILVLDFIIDNPYETKKDILKTYHYLLNLPRGIKPNLFFLSFFPGTPIYERALKDGIIKSFDENQFRSYVRSGIRYQKNFETLLILLLRIAIIHPKLRKIPKIVFIILASRLVRILALLLPETLIVKIANSLQIQKLWRKKR